MTLQQLQACLPYAGDRAAIFLDCLNAAFVEFGIDTPQRIASALAQLAHESGSLRYTREIADGSAYEGRTDLGNVQPGDGKRYVGRGFLQVTGRANTEACLAALGRKLDDLSYLETPIGASRSAGWFWKTHGLNAFADRGLFASLTAAINGKIGQNGIRLAGLDDRITGYVRCLKALGV